MIALVTDIDGTLLGDASGLERLNGFIERNRASFRLIYATGRDLPEFMRAVGENGLIRPDFAVLATGSELYRPGGDGYEPDREWQSRMAATGFSAAAARSCLDGTPGLGFQAGMLPYKLSCYFDGADHAAATREAAARLEKASIRAKLIASHNFYLDILPEGCDKGRASLYACGALGCSVGSAVAAGDSENDLDLFYAFAHSILVGNARAGLKESLEGRDAYRARAGFAAGVLEGLEHYMKSGSIKL